jgi:hypothetical protein
MKTSDGRIKNMALKTDVTQVTQVVDEHSTWCVAASFGDEDWSACFYGPRSKERAEEYVELLEVRQATEDIFDTGTDGGR